MSISPEVERRIEEEARAQIARDPDAALARAVAAHDAAVLHKREARRHDRRAVVQKVTFKVFKAQLEELGIEVVIEEQATDAQGGTSDNHRKAA